jgi:hypothetical protein
MKSIIGIAFAAFPIRDGNVPSGRLAYCKLLDILENISHLPWLQSKHRILIHVPPLPLMIQTVTSSTNMPITKVCARACAILGIVQPANSVFNRLPGCRAYFLQRPKRSLSHLRSPIGTELHHGMYLGQLKLSDEQIDELCV